jgi:hypothetical protein
MGFRLKIAAALCAICAAASVVASSCGGPSCRSVNDCPFGYYCVVSSGSAVAKGECKQDCQSAADCPQPNGNLAYAVCNNQGRCENVDRPPRLTVLEPEDDQLFPEGTRSVRVSGEVRSAASEVTVTIEPTNDDGCGGGGSQSVTLTNPNNGTFAKLSFVIDNVYLDPGKNKLTVGAVAGSAQKVESVGIQLDCPGCAQISIADPKGLASVPGLELGRLDGAIMPSSVNRAVWRVHGLEGDVLDGALEVQNGGFSIDRIPLFPGINRVEVIVSGVGSGLGEARCSSLVESGIAHESGLRLILSHDDSSADLDLHVIGPSGSFNDPATSLSIRSEHPSFGGTVVQDFDGPEVATIGSPPDGVYGVIVEPVIDGPDLGEDATLHVLFNGRTASPRPLGPQHLTALDGKLWVAGTVRIESGAATWTAIDQLVDGTAPPTTPPSMWPTFH